MLSYHSNKFCFSRICFISLRLGKRKHIYRLKLFLADCDKEKFWWQSFKISCNYDTELAVSCCMIFEISLLVCSLLRKFVSLNITYEVWKMIIVLLPRAIKWRKYFRSVTCFLQIPLISYYRSSSEKTFTKLVIKKIPSVYFQWGTLFVEDSWLEG